MKTWKTFSFLVNGLPVEARFTQENIDEIFLPLLHRLDQMQKERGKRIIVFLAAPPATGKSTLAMFLAHLSKENNCTAMQAIGLDGFHYHQDYILAHTVKQKDGTVLPMKQLKGSPETYDVPHFREKLEALWQGDPMWPIYDRRLHDVVEEKLLVTAPVVLIEGNWLLFQEGQWKELASLADYTVYIRAEEKDLKERLIGRKMLGGFSREEAEEFYKTGDGVSLRPVLQGSRLGDLSLTMDADGSFSVLK